MRNPGNRPWVQLVGAEHTFPHTVSSCKASPLWPKLLSEGTRPHTLVYLPWLRWCHWNCWCSPMYDRWASQHFPASVARRSGHMTKSNQWTVSTGEVLSFQDKDKAMSVLHPCLPLLQWQETEAGRLDHWVSRWQELPPAPSGPHMSQKEAFVCYRDNLSS